MMGHGRIVCEGIPQALRDTPDVRVREKWLEV